MHFLQASNSDISVLIVCNKTGGTIQGDIKKHEFPIAAFTLRPATTDWRQAQEAADMHSAWGAAFGSIQLMQFERVADEVYMETNQNKWLHLESSRHESNRLDLTGLCLCQQPYVLHSESASVA